MRFGDKQVIRIASVFLRVTIKSSHGSSIFAIHDPLGGWSPLQLLIVDLRLHLVWASHKYYLFHRAVRKRFGLFSSAVYRSLSASSLDWCCARFLSNWKFSRHQRIVGCSFLFLQHRPRQWVTENKRSGKIYFSWTFGTAFADVWTDWWHQAKS